MIVWRTDWNTLLGSEKINNFENYHRGTPKLIFRTFPVFNLYQWFTWICEKNNQITVFTDDTSLVIARKRKECQIQRDIEKMAVWFTWSKLTVNASKCEVLNFGLGVQQCIAPMNQKVPWKTSCKYLGLHIDCKMLFADHIDYKVKKLNRFSGLVFEVRRLCPKMFTSFLKFICGISD